MSFLQTADTYRNTAFVFTTEFMQVINQVLLQICVSEWRVFWWWHCRGHWQYVWSRDLWAEHWAATHILTVICMLQTVMLGLTIKYLNQLQVCEKIKNWYYQWRKSKYFASIDCHCIIICNIYIYMYFMKSRNCLNI